MRQRAAAFVLAVGALAGLAGWHRPTPTPKPVSAPVGGPLGVPGTWRLDWSDDFNGTTVDTGKWNVAGHAPGGALNCYDAQHVTESGGSLHLKLEHKTATCAGGTVTRDYVSGSVSGKQTFTGGAFEARVNVPNSGTQVANWPAWWAVAWPAVGEIDWWEGLGSAGSCWSVHPEPADPAGCVAPTPGWHTFGGVWTNGVGVDVYYDGRKVATVPFTTASAEYPVLDNATATWVSVVTPADMQVDYVKHWSK